MFRRLCNWVKSIFRKPTSTPTPAPTPDKFPEVEQPEAKGEYAFEWDNKRYDKYLVEAIKNSKLMGLIPADKAEFGTEKDPILFWGRILARMAYYESKWNTDAKYQESFRDRNGDRIWSRGLFQLSIESGRGYDRTLESEQSLHDPEVNIGLAVKIMEKLVGQNGRIAGKVSGRWQGGARYWSVLRGEREYTAKALASIKDANK